MAKRKIPDYLLRIFQKHIDESKLNEEIVKFILKNRASSSVTYTDVAEEFSLVKALHRMYLREEIQVQQSRIELIGSKSKKAPVKKPTEKKESKDKPL